MNRTEVIDAYFAFCKQAGYEPHQVILSAGAAMVMFGDRETTADLDIDIDAHDYAQFVCQRPSGERRSSLGAFFDYDDVVSLHAMPEGTAVATHPTPKGLVYTYSWMGLVEQKVRLVEMPDRNPEKIPRDLHELDDMVLTLAMAGGNNPEVRALIERAGQAKAKHF